MASKIDILDIHEFGQEQELSGFYCNAFEDHLRTHHKAITVPHKHNFFLTVIFTRGTGTHEIDFERYDVLPGSVFMLNPGQTHYWELSDDIEGIILFHSKEFFDVNFTTQSVFDFPFFYSVHNPSALFLNTAQTASLVGSFNHMLQEYSKRQAFSTQKIVSLLNGIYIDLSRIYLHSGHNKLLKPGKYAGYLRKLEELIEENFKKEKSASAYADKLNITKRHLNRLTQEMLGKSTTQLITERVILEAKRLVVYGPSSLSDISYELGYGDYTYFSRLFKKWTGLTPSEFGKTYRSADGK